MKKNVFVDDYKWSDMVKDCKKFLNKIEELKLYLVEFHEDGTMKNKMYPPAYAVRSENCQSIIIIIYDEYIFLANDGICKAWIRIRNTFLRLKSQRQGLIVSESLLTFGCLNLFSLFEEK